MYLQSKNYLCSPYISLLYELLLTVCRLYRNHEALNPKLDLNCLQLTMTSPLTPFHQHPHRFHVTTFSSLWGIIIWQVISNCRKEDPSPMCDYIPHSTQTPNQHIGLIASRIFRRDSSSGPVSRLITLFNLELQVMFWTRAVKG